MSTNPKKPPVIPMDAPYSPGSAPPRAQTAPPPRSPAPDATDFDAGRALVRLLVGSAMLGADEMHRRLRTWEHEMRNLPPPAPRIEEIARADLIRYAVIGLIFETHEQTRKGMNEMFDNMANATGALLTHMGAALNNPVVQPFAQPLLDQMDEWIERSAERTAKLARLGMREEQRSRLLAERVYAELADEMMAQVVEQPRLADEPPDVVSAEADASPPAGWWARLWRR